MLMRPWMCAVALATTTACGHPASQAECEEIVERIARLEYQKEQASAADLEKGIEDIKAQVRESMMKDCVGKRITESAMKCVRNAKDSQEIVEECFD